MGKHFFYELADEYLNGTASPEEKLVNGSLLQAVGKSKLNGMILSPHQML